MATKRVRKFGLRSGAVCSADIVHPPHHKRSPPPQDGNQEQCLCIPLLWLNPLRGGVARSDGVGDLSCRRQNLPTKGGAGLTKSALARLILAELAGSHTLDPPPDLQPCS